MTTRSVRTRRVVVTAHNGIHARPVAELVRLAAAHTDVVMLRSAAGAADLSSVLAVMDLALDEGDEVMLETTDSPTAERLLDELAAVLDPQA